MVDIATPSLLFIVGLCLLIYATNYISNNSCCLLQSSWVRTDKRKDLYQTPGSVQGENDFPIY